MLLSARVRMVLLALAVLSVLLVVLLRYCSGESDVGSGSVDISSADYRTLPLLSADGRQQHILRLNPPQRTPNSVRLVILSDTHTHHSELDIPNGDILIYAGDYASARTSAGRLREKKSFDDW